MSALQPNSLGRPVEAGTEAGPLRMTVAIPALNEEATIADVIRAIPRIPGIELLEVVVVDDGSRDNTVAQARQAGARVISHGTNRGVGRAFRTALNCGLDNGSDLIVTLDADGQFDPADIGLLIEPVVAGEADFATASRFLKPELIPPMPWIKKVGNRLMSRLISVLVKRRYFDVSCGMRCYSRRAAARLYLTADYTYTQEVFLSLAFRGLRIAEVPVQIKPRSHGTSRVASNLFRYGLQTLKIIVRCYRDHKPLKMFAFLAGLLMIPALGLGIFLLAHYIMTGAFSPHKWAAFLSISLFVLALLMIHIGMIGDMLNRHRLYLEELLHRDRVRNGSRLEEKD